MFTDELNRVLKRASELATEQGTNYTATEHVLKAIAETQSVAREILKRHGLDPEQVQTDADEILGR